MRQEAVHPGSLRRGGAAHAEARAHALDGARGAVVKLVVGGFFRIASPEVNVGLIPHFEIPLRDFLDAVARDKMPRKVLNELLPFVPVFRRRNVLFVPEGMERIRIGSELFGHEAELDEWADVILEQAVVDLIDIGEVVDGLAFPVLIVQANLVMEDGMEADVFKAGDAFGFAEVVAVAFAQRQDSAAGAKHFFPEVREWMRGGPGIHFDSLRWGSRLCANRGQWKSRCREKQRDTESVCAKTRPTHRKILLKRSRGGGAQMSAPQLALENESSL